MKKNGNITIEGKTINLREWRFLIIKASNVKEN